ncbi:hypothetical protein FA13DRAFT_1739330 [Coprinellus micaceus]|uniref:Uncharacterized protein n=1 Tax=Coprinellus micaceus TaxID=71717 RepID=A0A4Y7SRF5_COPMI|nr:hypothetical protein FA13DRAFT_1739330 [Coprinellus micaceus]
MHFLPLAVIRCTWLFLGRATSIKLDPTHDELFCRQAIVVSWAWMMGCKWLACSGIPLMGSFMG